MINYTKKVAKSTLTVFLMAILTAALSYSIRIVFARNLSPPDFGLFYAIFTLLLFFLIFRDIGLEPAITKFVAEYNTKKNYSKIKTLIITAIILQMISSFILIGALIILNPILSKYYFKTSQSLNIIFILLIYVLISIFYRNTRSILLGFQDTKWYSISEPVRLGSTLAFSILFFHLGFGIIAPPIGLIFGVATAFLVLLAGLSKYFFVFSFRFVNPKSTVKQLINFGIQVIFTGFGGLVIGYLDVLILTYLASLNAVGIYNAILPTATMLLFLGGALSTVLLPIVSELWVKDDKIRISEAMRLVYNYSFVLAIPFIFTLFAFSKIFINLLFGPEYVAGILAFRVLLIGILFYTVAIINNTAITGIGKPKIVTKIILSAAAVNLIFNLLLIPKFKITGAAIATSISYFTILLLSTRKLSQFVEVNSPWKNWIKTIFSGGIFLLVIFMVGNFLHFGFWSDSIFSLLSAGILYLILIFSLKVVKLNELKSLIKRLI